jgi:hypothetical protein
VQFERTSKINLYSVLEPLSLDFAFFSPIQPFIFNEMAEPTLEESLLLVLTTAIEALDYDTIQEIYTIQPQLLWEPLQPLAHLENDFSHFIRRLEEYKILGSSIRPMYALHHILFDYGVPGDEWAPERTVLVDFILKVCFRDIRKIKHFY